MANKVTMKVGDNVNVATDLMRRNVKNCLEVLGLKLIERALDHAENKFGRYHKKIYITGNLQRSVTYSVKTNSVSVGSNLEYAKWVHEGTKKTVGRPFLLDAVTYKPEELQGIINYFLSRHF